MNYGHFDIASHKHNFTHPSTRGVIYRRTASNQKHIIKGVEKVIVNGKQVEGNMIRAEAAQAK